MQESRNNWHEEHDLSKRNIFLRGFNLQRLNHPMKNVKGALTKITVILFYISTEGLHNKFQYHISVLIT